MEAEATALGRALFLRRGPRRWRMGPGDGALGRRRGARLPRLPNGFALPHRRTPRLGLRRWIQGFPVYASWVSCLAPEKNMMQNDSARSWFSCEILCVDYRKQNNKKSFDRRSQNYSQSLRRMAPIYHHTPRLTNTISQHDIVGPRKFPVF